MGYQQFCNAEKFANSDQAMFEGKSIEEVKEIFPLLQATLDAIVDGVIVVGCNYNVCHYNCKLIEMWNIQDDFFATKNNENLLTLLIEKLKYPEEYVAKENKLHADPIMEGYDVIELKDGRTFERYSKPQWLNNMVIGRVLTFRDITKYIQAEKAVQQNEEKFRKEMAHIEGLNVVGQMAAGIGHEIRNPLTTIRGFLQVLRNKKDCLKYWEYYKLMIGELDRANEIITGFLSLAKERLACRQSNNINTIIKSLLPMMEADAILANKYIKVELTEIPDFLLDDTEIRQLILNLIRNSLEAMSAGGYLTIKTYLEGNDIILAVKDQGTGIDPAVLKKIGTPFFTTKEQGTGLGLAICFNIAARHNAVINVETCDKGTTFLTRFSNGDCAMVHTVKMVDILPKEGVI